MDTQRLLRATAIGTALQFAMVIGGHYLPLIRDNFMFGGLAISLFAGVLYAARSAGGWGACLGGGAIAGGACALIGIAVSCALGDVPAPVLLFGTLGSTVTGILGAVLGRVLLPARGADS